MFRLSNPLRRSLTTSSTCKYQHTKATPNTLILSRSSSTSTRLGIDQFQVTIGDEGVHSTSHGYDPQGLLRQFDSVCQGLQQNGLALCLGAAAALTERLPAGVSGRLTADFRPLNLSLVSGAVSQYQSTSTLAISVYANWNSFTGIRLVLLRRFRFEGTLSESGASIIQLKNVVLFAKYRTHPKPDSDILDIQQVSAQEEIEILANATLQIISRVCAEMSFGSWQALATTNAEAVLRVVKFSSPDIVLEEVHIELASVSEKVLDVIGRARMQASVGLQSNQGMPTSPSVQSSEHRNSGEALPQTGSFAILPDTTLKTLTSTDAAIAKKPSEQPSSTNVKSTGGKSTSDGRMLWEQPTLS